MNRASAFGRGNWAATQNALSAISYEIYTSDPSAVDPDAIVRKAWRKYTKFTPIPDTHFWAAFGHLAGYSSAYYTYLWDKVIAEDFASQFDRANLLADGPSMRYRQTVLEPGGTQSANDLVKNFLGRPQDMRAFEAWIGEEFAGKGTPAAGGKSPAGTASPRGPVSAFRPAPAPSASGR
jgi:thimet oligopeptidase